MPGILADHSSQTACRSSHYHAILWACRDGAPGSQGANRCGARDRNNPNNDRNNNGFRLVVAHHSQPPADASAGASLRQRRLCE